MKKLKKIAYIVLVAIVIILSLTVYTNATKDNSKIQEEKTYSEVQYLKSKLENLLNTMNNIESRNYKVSISEINSQTDKKTQEETSTNGNSEESDSKSEKNNSSSENGGSSEKGTQSTTDSDKAQNNNQKNEKFDLKTEGVLKTSDDNINWDNIKEEIEILYTSLPTITVDLYKTSLNKDEILNFNKEFDNLTVAAQNEQKEETLTELAKLYDYIPKFVQSTTDKEVDKIISETKSNIYKAYSKLDIQDWEAILNDVKNANESYSRLLTKTDIDKDKQYHISKGYIMINELQNSIRLKDKSVFLIKYKNLIEEVNNI